VCSRCWRSPLLCALASGPPPTSPPFPYTTLFRSRDRVAEGGPRRRGGRRRQSHRAAHPRRGAQAGGSDQEPARDGATGRAPRRRSEEHTSELQSLTNLVCRLLLEKKKTNNVNTHH